MTLTVEIPAVIRQEGEVFVASCPPLDVFSQGDTPEEARKMLWEAVALFLGTCIEMDKEVSEPARLRGVPVTTYTQFNGDLEHEIAQRRLISNPAYMIYNRKNPTRCFHIINMPR